MKIFRIFILIIVVCFMCNLVLAEDENKLDSEFLRENIALIIEDKNEVQIDEVVPKESIVLKSGTLIDDKTLTVLEQHRRYSELANLRLATIKLVIEKASSDYFNTFKIWLALNGVKQAEFDRWEIKRNKAFIKEKEGG